MMNLFSNLMKLILQMKKRKQALTVSPFTSMTWRLVSAPLEVFTPMSKRVASNSFRDENKQRRTKITHTPCVFTGGQGQAGADGLVSSAGKESRCSQAHPAARLVTG